MQAIQQYSPPTQHFCHCDRYIISRTCELAATLPEIVRKLLSSTPICDKNLPSSLLSDNLLLEMICDEPNPISGERNGVFAQPLIGYRKCGKSITEGGSKREIGGQIRVVLRPVSLVLFTVKKKNLSGKEKRPKKTSEPRNY